MSRTFMSCTVVVPVLDAALPSVRPWASDVTEPMVINPAAKLRLLARLCASATPLVVPVSAAELVARAVPKPNASVDDAAPTIASARACAASAIAAMVAPGTELSALGCVGYCASARTGVLRKWYWSMTGCGTGAGEHCAGSGPPPAHGYGPSRSNSDPAFPTSEVGQAAEDRACAVDAVSSASASGTPEDAVLGGWPAAASA